MPEWTDEQIILRNMSAPIRDVMNFYLVYSGPLSASGNRKTGKQAEIEKIRSDLSLQLARLWETHDAL